MTRKRGFTFIEVMIAISLFLIMVVFIVKLDRTTSNEIKNVSEMTEKAEIAQGELEKFKAAPQQNASMTVPGYNGYIVTVESSNAGSVYTAVTEVTITVKKDTAAVDENQYVLKAHVLLK